MFIHERLSAPRDFVYSSTSLLATDFPSSRLVTPLRLSFYLLGCFLKRLGGLGGGE